MQSKPYTDIQSLQSSMGIFKITKHPVASQIQRGSTCGLYSLSIAGKAMTGKYVPATSGDISKDQAFSLRKAAKKMGFTQVGELFDAQQLVELAPLLGLTAQVIKVDASSFYNEIKKAIDTDALVIVPYSVDNSDPNQPGPGEVGNNAHWVLAFGYQETTPTTKKILITSWNYYFSYDADVFQRSNACITDWTASSWSKPEAVLEVGKPARKGTINDYNASMPGTTYKTTRLIPSAKLSDTLANKIVIISYKAGSTLLNGGIRIKVSSNDKLDSLELDYQLRSTIANFEKNGILNKDGVAELKWYMPEHIEIRFPGHGPFWSRISLNTRCMLPSGRYIYEITAIKL